MFSGKKVFITGVSGFKGAYLARVLSQLNAKVYGTVRRTIEERESSYHYLNVDNYITPVYVDVTNKDELFRVINKVNPDIIVHLAAQSVVASAFRDPVSCYETNVIGTLNLLDAARKMDNIEKFLITSTDHVFGNKVGNIPLEGFNELSPVDWSGTYDTSKACMELITKSFNWSYNMPHLIITRSSNVFGPGDCNSRRLIPLLFSRLLDEQPLPPLYKNYRQFIYIEDVIAGYILALLSPNELNNKLSIYHFSLANYGNGLSCICIHNIKKMMSEMFGASCSIDYDFTAPNEIPVLSINCDYTNQHLGWIASTNLADGFNKMYTFLTMSADLRSKFLDDSIECIINTVSQKSDYLMDLPLCL
jgi:Nucleoside-diphosphate-sugar epimerases